ncbi:hypothetical protein EJ04DRAFT_268129 [Polyplosphaeria fusca]|uniref:Uncharacterized protein n=1 Tax=Polyplosphaeria fusca TaxID=682080 RepID=A0A9P4V1U3_9PLEO|nr:hypothetical protein EJ04DRAFT_268129 [Polyplosphaeria fusca]
MTRLTPREPFFVVSLAPHSQQELGWASAALGTWACVRAMVCGDGCWVWFVGDTWATGRGGRKRVYLGKDIEVIMSRWISQYVLCVHALQLFLGLQDRTAGAIRTHCAKTRFRSFEKKHGALRRGRGRGVPDGCLSFQDPARRGLRTDLAGPGLGCAVFGATGRDAD